MALAFKRTFFSTSTAVATSTVTVAHGLGVVPKFLYITWVGRTETVDAVGLATQFRGASYVNLTSAFTYWTVANSSENGIATGTRNSKCCSYNNSAVALLTTTGTTDGLMSVQSVDATNVVFQIDDAFSIDMRCQMVALGGTDITGVYVGSLATPTAGTPPFTTDYTTAGLAWTDNRALLMTLGCKSTTVNTGADDSDFYMGMATSATQQRSLASGANNNQAAATQTQRYSSIVETIGQFDAADTVVIGRAAFNVGLATGFQLNWLEVGTAANLIGYAMIVGPRFAISHNNWSSTINQTVAFTGAGFSARGGVIFATGSTDVQDTVIATDNTYLGAWDAVGSEGCFHALDTDNVATSAVGTRLATTSSVARVQTAGTNNGAHQLQSIDADGCTYICTATGTSINGPTVFFGDAPTTTGGGWVDPAGSMSGGSWVDPLALTPMTARTGET